LRVVHLGVDECFLATHRQRAAPPYLFHLGSSDVRDNTRSVIEAYVRLVEQWPEAPPLRVAGNLGELRLGLTRLVDRHRTNVSFLGRVSDIELARLYAGASLCVQPSADEGFGLQPLEALATGSPVLVVDLAVTREVLDDAAFFTPTADPPSLAAAMRGVLTDVAALRRASAAGPATARRYSWDATASSLREILTAAVYRRQDDPPRTWSLK